MLKSRRVLVVLATVLVLSTGVLGRAAPVAAKDDPPPPPASFDVGHANGVPRATVTETIPGVPASPRVKHSTGKVDAGPTRLELELQACESTPGPAMTVAGCKAALISASLERFGFPTPAGVGAPATAARQVVAGMDLQLPAIGMVPRPTTVDPSSVGLVGMNNWLWVDNPEIFQTVSDTAAIDGWVISVSGRVESVDWDMGDGQVIHCTGPGTPYEPRFDMSPSPDCGHVYSVQGYYTVTATAHWSLQWSGGGQSGTFMTDQVASAPVVIGEAIAVRRS